MTGLLVYQLPFIISVLRHTVRTESVTTLHLLPEPSLENTTVLFLLILGYFMTTCHRRR